MQAELCPYLKFSKLPSKIFPELFPSLLKHYLHWTNLLGLGFCETRCTKMFFTTPLHLPLHRNRAERDQVKIVYPSKTQINDNDHDMMPIMRPLIDVYAGACHAAWGRELTKTNKAKIERLCHQHPKGLPLGSCLQANKQNRKYKT